MATHVKQNSIFPETQKRSMCLTARGAENMLLRQLPAFRKALQVFDAHTLVRARERAASLTRSRV
jgi:hypothetical protein